MTISVGTDKSQKKEASGSEKGGVDERRLLDALDHTYDLLESGECNTPDDAVCKSAALHRVPPGQIHLLTTSYNTGRFNYRRQATDDVYEKAASFPLASAAACLKRLYPKYEESEDRKSHTKKASSGSGANAAFLALFGRGGEVDGSPTQAFISPDYSGPPPSWLRPYLRPTVHPSVLSSGLKEAQAAAPAVDRWDELRKQEAKKASERAALRRAVDEAVVSLERAIGLAKKAYEKAARCVLPDALRASPGAPSFAEVKAQTEAAYGAPGKLLMKHLSAGRDACMSMREKIAAADEAAAASRYSAFREDAEPYLSLSRCVRAFEGFSGACKELDALRAKEAAASDVGGGSDAGGGGKSTYSSFMAGGNKALSSAGTAWGAANRALAAPVVDYAMADKNFRSEDDKAFEALTSPEHEFRMQKIRVQALLHDMLANDPVISGYDPEEVTGVFNDLQRLAPRALSEPSVTRAVLRQALAQGGLGTHEITQMADLENKLYQTKSLPRDHVPDAAKPLVRGRGYDSPKPPKPTKSILSGILSPTGAAGSFSGGKGD